MAKVYYKKDGELIPFDQFLWEEREKRGISWRKLGKACGVERLASYAYKNTTSQPNNPTLGRFKTIISALGYSQEDFIVRERLVHRAGEQDEGERDENYESVLKRIGDFINSANEERGRKGYRKLSSTLIRRVGGEPFYYSYGNTLEKRRRLHQDIINLGEEYQSIELQHQKQQKTGFHPLAEQEGFSEKEAIIKLVLEYFEQNQKEWDKGITSQVVKYVRTGLNPQLKEHDFPERSLSSVNYQVRKLWSGEERLDEFIRGSPKPSSLEEKLSLEEPLSWLEAARELGTGIFELAGKVNEKRVSYFEKEEQFYFTAEALAVLKGEKVSAEKEEEEEAAAQPQPETTGRGEVTKRIRSYSGFKISHRTLDTLSLEEMVLLDDGLKQGKNRVELLGELSRRRRKEYFQKIYSHPNKALWRAKWREFIQTNLLTDEGTSVLCLPGPEALEIIEVYDKLGIARGNITGVERDPERYFHIESKKLGIELVNRKVFGFLAETGDFFDIVMLDFDGSFTPGKNRGLEEMADRKRLRKDSLLGLNFFRKKADTERLVEMLTRKGYTVTYLERYVYQTINGNSFYSDFFRIGSGGRRIGDVPEREELKHD